VYDFGRTYGESCYRLMSRSGQFIYLKTRGSLEIDETTRQVHSFVCVNSLVSDDEGRKLIREMKKKFSAIISEAELSAMESDVPAVENPQNLERAILNLITNLNNAASYDDDNISMLSDSTVEEDSRKIKSPPLAIIPPKPNTIKPSIFKATAVMGNSKGGNSPSIKEEPKSPATPNQSSCGESSLGIKTEPAPTLLSPTSGSSFDSDNTSSFLSPNNNHSQQTVVSGALSVLPNKSNFEPYENLPVYDIEATTTTESIIMTSNSVNNNNNSNLNRNSVLKRTYPDEDDAYSELIKKPALAVRSPVLTTPPTSQPIDLLDTSVSGM
jgi:PAS domain